VVHYWRTTAHTARFAPCNRLSGRKPIPFRIPSSELRFEHYTVLQNAEGKPFELGHGGMGVTYKAFDVHLQRPAALKIINAQLLGNESARARFIREARAAASVRHQNVASVFHIGETGGNYYYAMELVEGESLAVDDDENEVTEQPLSNLSDLPDSAEGLLLACHGQGTAGRKLISTASERRIPFVCRRRKRPLSQDGEAGR
jgi:hypothetical protein